MNFLEFHEKTHQLQLQISTLTSICKVGPYTKMEEIPHGVALLNYLYQKVLSLTDQKIISVLYSILYPCCQVYFSRFLKQWILDGVIHDPYGEFFIKPNPKFVITRGRTYWTRSFSLREDIVPDFLVDLKTEILSCGKSMSLLKFFEHTSKLRLYLMGKKPHIISCCLTLDQLSNLQQNTVNYYLDVHEECGSRFNLREVLLRNRKEDDVLMGLIAKKRAATLKKLELEREKILLEQNEKKFEEMNMLKEQYVAALEEKQLRIAKEIQEELNQVEESFETELKRQKLIQEEANVMIDYYSKLIEIADNRKSKIETNVKKIKSIQIEQNSLTKDKEHFESTDNLGEKSNSSSDSFYSIPEDKNDDKVEVENMETESDRPEINSPGSLDVINANADTLKSTNEPSDKIINSNHSRNIQEAINNFEMARKNKYKVMTQEMGIDFIQKKEKTTSIHNAAYLSDAQRNKLKILSTEFGFDIKPDYVKTNQITTISMYNRNKVMGSSDCFAEKYLDNENFVNRNLASNEESSVKTGPIKKSKSLMLDFDKVSTRSAKSDTDKQIPMSVDSTPMSELPHSVGTPSTMFLSIDTNQLESIPNTAETHQTDEGFKFDTIKEQSIDPIYYNRKEISLQKAVFSKRVTKKQASGVSTNCLRLFLHESVQIPLLTQTKLINDELLRYFINDLQYLQHLMSLRDYFFMQDGEFGRNITENLFTKLYDANFPAELINCRILQDLVFGALDMSYKNQTNSQCLSFKINSMPKCFDLGNPDVLDCLSLTYKVKWPLNILLPTDTIAKYDEVFKFLLKLNRVSWVLKKTFLELKVLAKETGKKEIYLMSSPQYRKLHQCRHVMTQFVQTLQNYVVGEVLQSSWTLFEKNLEGVSSIDELYSAHTAYIKNILFMCLLNQKTVILRNVIHKTFMVILKFFDYLRSRSWICENGSYVHPNFNKLESIFKNFQEFVLYLFKVGRKVAKCGYQPHLSLLLEMLDINEYFSESLKRSSN
nr:gamma-tubulin complex component 6 [Leptinotarsa decemlineata]